MHRLTMWMGYEKRQLLFTNIDSAQRSPIQFFALADSADDNSTDNIEKEFTVKKFSGSALTEKNPLDELFGQK